MNTILCVEGEHYFDPGECDYFDSDDGIICLNCLTDALNNALADNSRLRETNAALIKTVKELQFIVTGIVTGGEA